MRKHLFTAAVALAVCAMATTPASGFVAVGAYATGRLYYTIDQSFLDAGFLANSLWAAEQGWKIQGVAGYAEFWNDPNQPGASTRRVRQAYIDGPGYRDAEATVGCGTTCIMTFEAAATSPWNTTTDIRDDGWYDFVGIATHEFGHWMGLNHWNNTVASDGNATPTMQDPRNPAPGKHFRTIQSDDVNGFHAVRGALPRNLLANGSFEYTSAGWGGSAGQGWLYRRPGSTGSATRYCSGSISGSCFFEYNGAGAVGTSLFQDLWVSNASWMATSSMTLRAKLKSPVYTGSVTAAVWALEPSGVVIYQRTCTLPPGQWVELSSTASACSGAIAFSKPSTTQLIRVEIYNNDAWNNLDVDDVRLEF